MTTDRTPPTALGPAPWWRPETSPEHTGQAWYTNGWTNEPAVLRLTRGRLSLHVAAGIVFDERLADLERIHVPWYWFSGGIVVAARGRKHKIVFVRPNGAPDPDGGLLALLGHSATFATGVGALATGSALLGEVGGIARGTTAVLSIAPGRAAGKTWRALLGV
jgi:hypothetical protein